MSARRALAGFTLVELAVVLMVLAVVAAVAAPALGRPPGGARRVADSLAAVYRLGRRAAGERGATVTVALDLGRGRYLISTTAADTLPAWIAGGELPLEDGTRLTAGGTSRVEARFDARGRARAAPVNVSDAREHYRITVDSWGASVHVRAR